MTRPDIFSQRNWDYITDATFVPSVPARRWQKEQRDDHPAWATAVGSRPHLFAVVSLLQPKVAIETGTHEAIGTTIIANAMQPGSMLTTFDYDGDPSCPLEEPSPGEDYATADDWTQLAHLRLENIAAIPRNGVTVRFVNGDTRKVLREIISKDAEHLGRWDFWYQDSMHDLHGIRQEWEAIRDFAAPGAVVVFDNIEWNDHDPHPWGVWFKENARDWEPRFVHWGANQLWAQKR